MGTVTGARGVAVLAAALSLSGCAATFNGYDVAANGLPRAEDALRHRLAQDPAGAYQTVVEGDRQLPDDDLLRLLYAATAARYAGEYQEGGQLLDIASYLADDRRTASLSRETLSLLTSDRALAFVPGRTERLMIPYVAATLYLEADDLQAAAVEARRIEALLDRMADEGDEDTARRTFLHTFAGTVFEAAGDVNAADVAFRRAAARDTAGTAALPPRDSTGQVVVLVERGFVPHRVEQSVAVVLPSRRVEDLTDGSAGERLAAAADAAGRILFTANRLFGDRSGYYRDYGFRRPLHLRPWDDDCRSDRGDDCEDTDESPYVLRISWPVLYQDAAPAAPVRVRAGELGADPVARFDVTAGALRDFDAERPAMLTRLVLRAVAKLGLTSAVQDAVEEKDEVAGDVVGALANLSAFLTERADIRCWHLLPASVSMVRLQLPAGAHALEIEDGGDGQPVALGTVRVEPGRTTFLTRRIWR